MMEFLFRKHPIFREFYKYSLSRAFGFLYRGDGVKVMKEDWDNLIVLDACRYDFFERYNWIEGELRREVSLGSHTAGWVKRNFQGRYPSTVVISGTPQLSGTKLKQRVGKNPFYKLINVWDWGWDEEGGTVPPAEVTDAAVDARKDHPDKRLLIQYMQPHRPFKGKRFRQILRSFKKSSDLRSEPLEPPNFFWEIFQPLLAKFPHLSEEVKRKKHNVGHIWDKARQGKITPPEIKAGYVENLKWVLEEVERLVEELNGKTVITSDHGDLFGEHCLFGHHRNIRFKELVMVPWLEVAR